MGNLVSWAAVENLFTGVPADPSGGPQCGRPPEGSQVDRSDGAARPVNPFWARMGAEITRQPVRVFVACLATVLVPAVVASASAADPQKASSPPAAVPMAAAGPAQPGDTGSWLVAARKAAGACPGLPAAVLVAVGQVETGLGALSTTSAAGAVGPMQFLPSTWAAYGADGDGDGLADPRNPADALAGATRLLCANGGADSDRLASALWNYNHSNDYVRQVLAAARLLPG